MNTVAERLGLHQLEYGEVGRGVLDQEATWRTSSSSVNVLMLITPMAGTEPSCRFGAAGTDQIKNGGPRCKARRRLMSRHPVDVLMLMPPRLTGTEPLSSFGIATADRINSGTCFQTAPFKILQAIGVLTLIRTPFGGTEPRCSCETATADQIKNGDGLDMLLAPAFWGARTSTLKAIAALTLMRTL
jgi:hypothetical protein